MGLDRWFDVQIVRLDPTTDWYRATALTNGLVGTGAGTLELAAGRTTIAVNGWPKLYKSGWGGNKFTRTARLAKIGARLGIATAISGTLMDAAALSLDPSDANAISAEEFTRNLLFTAISFAGPAGFVIGTAYFATDALYENGVDGLLADIGNLEY